MRNPHEEPGQRGPFERPADRDPLLLELQRNCHRDERQRRPGDERQTADLPLAGPLQMQELNEQDGHERRLEHREGTDDAREATVDHRLARHEKERNAREDRGLVRFDRVRSRLPSTSG